MSRVQQNMRDGSMQFESPHLRLVFEAATGFLSEVQRRADGAILFARNGAQTLKLCVDGMPASNRIPEPDPRTTQTALPIQYYMGLAYDAKRWPFQNSLVHPDLPQAARLVGDDARLLGIAAVDTGDTLEITVEWQDGDWRFGIIYGLHQRLPLLDVDLVVQYCGAGTARLNYIAWPWAGWRFGGESVLPGFDSRVRSLAAGGSVLLWRSGDGEWWVWNAVRDEEAGQDILRLMLGMGGRLCAGERLRGGRFHVGFSDPAAKESIGGEILAAWNSAYGVGGVPQVPDWGRYTHIYETFIGSAPLRGGEYAPHPTTEALIADLPRIRDLGYDTIYLMPRHPWPGYAWESYADPALQHGDGPGTEQRFRALLAAIHAHGMRVILDIITAGVMDQECVQVLEKRSEFRRKGGFGDGYWDAFEENHLPVWREQAPKLHPYWVEHPEWFAQLDDGEPHIHFTKKLDTRHPGLRAFIAKSLVRLLADYDVDGFRIDAPWWGGYCYRWQQGAGYRASWSIGATGPFVAQLQEAAREVRQDALFFVETATPDLIACRYANLVYGSDELPVARGLLEGSVAGGERKGIELFGIEGALWLAGAESSAYRARRALAFLRQYRLPGMPVVHWIDCHDSVWFAAAGQQWTREMYGQGATEAAFALCCFMDGALMNFAGGELGIEQKMSTLLKLRHRLPPLRDGRCGELAVGCDHDRVLPVWRELDGDWLVGVVNFSDQVSRAQLRLPVATVPALVDHLGVVAVNAVNDAAVTIELPPYGAALLGPRGAK